MIKNTSSEKNNTLVSQILSEDFSFIKTSGGPIGILGSILPTFVFVISYIITKDFALPIILALVISVIFGIISFIFKKPISQIIFGILGVLVCGIWVYKTGRAENFFVLGLWTNLTYMFGLLVSVLVRLPLLGVLVETIFSSPFEWRKDPVKYRIYRNMTWLWIGMFALRLAVKTPLYMYGNLAWLGTAHIILSVPLYVLVVFVSWNMVKPIIRKNSDK